MGMFGLGTQVTAGAGGMRDAYLKYAEEATANGEQPMPPADFMKQGMLGSNSQFGGNNDEAIKHISGFKSPEEALQSLYQQVSSGVLPADKATTLIQSIPRDPKGFEAWKSKTLDSLKARK